MLLRTEGTCDRREGQLVPPSLLCGRDSSNASVHVDVTGTSVDVDRCSGEDGQGFPTGCTANKSFRRTP